MHLLIWVLGLMLLMLWSAVMWLGYSVTHIALTLPWQQGAAALGQLQIPALLKPFLDPILLIFADGSWKTWAEGFAPLMRWLGDFLQGSASWLTAALPVLAWIIWALGALAVLALAGSGSGALWWWRKKKTQMQAGGGGGLGGGNGSGGQSHHPGATNIHQLAQPMLERLKRKYFH